MKKRIFMEMHSILSLFLLLGLSLSFSCSSDKEEKEKEDRLAIRIDSLGTWEGQAILAYRLDNGKGSKLSILNLGAIITEWEVPTKAGGSKDIVLGYEDWKDYTVNGDYLGITVGRYANRIHQGSFELDGTQYQLSQNDGEHHLHGGEKGFDKKIWQVEPIVSDTFQGLRLHYLSPDGEEGYPGNLEVSYELRLHEDHSLSMDFSARSDQNTIVNLTNHNYYNLSAGERDILKHELKIYGNQITPVDQTLIPTGEIVEVAGSPFDFREYKPIGQDLADVPGGYDHNFIIQPQASQDLVLMADLYDPASEIGLRIKSNAPGLQFYSGNFIKELSGKKGNKYEQYHGLCLEPQLFPDSPNQASFPTAQLKAGEEYRHTILFEIKNERF